MFDASKYKKFARMQLKGRWGIPVLVSILYIIIVGILMIPDLAAELHEGTEEGILSFSTETKSDPFELLTSFLMICIFSTFSFGQLGLYLKMSRGPEKVHFTSFLEGLSSFVKASLAGIWKQLWIYLWSLLFVIPGFVKTFAYSQMFQLLSEYPDLSIPKAMNLSKAITRGHKGELFCMYMSFTGWAVLATIPCGLGWIFLLPYIKMSFVNAYHGLLKEAISSGTITIQDLTGKKTSNGETDEK